MASFAKAVISGFSILVMVFGTLPVPIWAQGPVIEHSPAACVATEGFPKFSATISGNLAAPPRFIFRCEPIGEDFFYVEMAAVEDAHIAILPTPMQPPCESIVYYIEAVDSDGNPAQSLMSNTVVTSGDCENDRLPAGAAPDIAVFDEAGIQVASVPGFSPTTSALAPGASGAAVAQGGASIYTNPWFWVGVGGAGAGVIAIVLATEEKKESSPTR
jgi:hypothetical protein